MAYALGYDPEGFNSDNEEDNLTTVKCKNRENNQDIQSLPTPIDMDAMDTAALERLGWMEPLGYRIISEVAGLSSATLRKHFWASKLKHTSLLYADIDSYFLNSHSQTHRVQMRLTRIVELKRFNENNSDFKVPNVQLLWHGTQMGNIGSILTNGFRLPTRQGMFGRGVYFADRVSKSTQYCHVSATRGNTGALFLCAVNLGRMYQSASGLSHLTAPPNGYDSVMGRGNNIPDPRDFKMHRGASMPCGKTVVNPSGAALIHNEFIVYDLSKIAILFLIEFEYL